ncbi:hypothetical protein ACE38V_18775 [Cytobacillus sp. Hz8]|uniref:hypothetical protein n=1 Tax=Cytobacillus sp. Hz8 TaxID=3347168 RepID=UPI0035D691EF
MNDFESSIESKIERIWDNTCQSFQNCTSSNIQSFLQECLENQIDPQFCMSWVEQHKSEIPDWNSVSETSLNWINQHTSTGSPYPFKENGY